MSALYDAYCKRYRTQEPVVRYIQREGRWVVVVENPPYRKDGKR